MAAQLKVPTEASRCGEKLVIAAVTPGTIAAIVLGLVLALSSLRWEPDLGPFGEAFAWAAIFTPALVTIGMVTLTGGLLAVPFAPGRPRYKWGILLAGTAAWWIAFHWLNVPGLIELP